MSPPRAPLRAPVRGVATAGSLAGSSRTPGGGLDGGSLLGSALSGRSRDRIISVAAVLLLGAGSLSAQGIDPSYLVHLTPQVEGATGTVRSVECFLDVDPSGSPLAAWSLGICHDAALVAPLAAVPGDALATLRNGAPVDFLILEFEPTLGVVHGVVVCFSSCASLPAATSDLSLFAVDYALVGEPGSTTQLATCDSVAISGNPVATIVVTTSAGSRVPLQQPAAVTILEPAFIRGDCGGDGDVSIADAIFLLASLFDTAVVVPCRDACDANDDGALNIADPVRALGYLFGGEGPLAAPFPACGTDPNPDDLPCASPPGGC